MMHGWKKFFRKRVACLLCAAMVLGYVPANGAGAKDATDSPGWENVTLQIEGEIVKDGTDHKVRLSVKDTDAFKDVPADLQEDIAYQWFFASNEVDLASQASSTKIGESYDLKGTDLTTPSVFIQVRAIYGGPTAGLNGVYPSGESRILEVKDGSLKVDAIAGVTVNGSGKGVKNGSIEIDQSAGNPNKDNMQYYLQESPEQVRDFDYWKLEGLSENQKVGVKYKKDVVLSTLGSILNELYAEYTIPLDESKTPEATPTATSPSTEVPADTAEPTEVPEITNKPTEVPKESIEPTKVPQTTNEPTEAVKPTKVPEVSAKPTERPDDTAEPTEKPADTAEPTKAPADTPEPTKAPSDATEPAPVDMNKPGTVATVGGAVYKSNGSDSVSYDGVKTDKKTVSVPDKVTVNGKSYPVTKISSGAFSGSKVQKVNLGKNVKVIGKKAFKNCKSLKKVAFSNKTTTVDAESFSGCAKLGSISLPATVKTVGAKAFKNCKKLKKFTLGKKPAKTKKGKVMFGAVGGKKVSIGASALENCLNLRSVIINSQVTKIGNNTFRNCKKLASMLVKSLKLKTVGNRALKGVSHCKISVPTIRLKKYRTLFTNKGQGKKVVIAKV